MRDGPPPAATGSYFDPRVDGLFKALGDTPSLSDGELNHEVIDRLLDPGALVDLDTAEGRASAIAHVMQARHSVQVLGAVLSDTAVTPAGELFVLPEEMTPQEQVRLMTGWQRVQSAVKQMGEERRAALAQSLCRPAGCPGGRSGGQERAVRTGAHRHRGVPRTSPGVMLWRDTTLSNVART